MHNNNIIKYEMETMLYDNYDMFIGDKLFLHPGSIFLQNKWTVY